MNYTNKVIFFTEQNYTGDALILMRDLSKSKGGCEEFSFNGHNLKIKKTDSFLTYQKNCESIIVEKGGVIVRGNGHDSGGAFWTNAPSVMPSNPCYEGLMESLTLVALPSYDVTYNKPRNGEPIRQDYFLTFYPKLNAYFISPAPLYELKNGKFRWVLHDDDTFTIDWDAEDVEHAYLEFFSHGETGEPLPSRDRAMPIEVKECTDPSNRDLPNWVAPLPQYAIKSKEIIKFTKGTDGALWAFNFCCFINGELFRVDPETKRGTGTGN